MAKNQLESNDSSLLPTSDDREDSGLQDLLSVAAKLKEVPADEPSDAPGDESGVIMFKAGDLGGDDDADDDDAMFGSFSGGLAAGFGTSVDPITSPDLTPLGGEGSVSEATGAEVRPKPAAEEPKRSALPAIAVVLGLGLAALGIVYVANNDKDKPQQQQAQAELSANNDDAAVGKAELPANDPAGASAGQPVQAEPEPEPEPVLEGETEGALLQGEDAGALLAADTTDGADPMAQKAGLLDSNGKPVSEPSGKWDQGKSVSNDSKASDPEPADEPEPDPDPVVAPKPTPEPTPTKPSGGGGNDDEVDCLLNPDLPKCNTGGSSKPKDEQVLAPKLSESLDQAQLRAGFNTVKSKAKTCGSKFGAEAGTKVKVHVSIEGSTGKVTAVDAQGEHAGTDLGKCVEDAVKGASFDQFKKPSQGADYSMIM